MRRALVLGGAGTVGRAVLRELAGAGVETAFTYHGSAELAARLAAELGQRALPVDATDGAELAALVRGLAPDVFIHCAGSLVAAPLAELDDATFDAAYALHGRAALIACRELAGPMAAAGRGDIVLVGGLDRAQSLPVPVAYAACQGMLAGITMALAKELGGRGIRINMVALGLLESGLSLGLSERIRNDYLTYSALRRFGKPEEAARAIVWLALHNRWLNGKVIPVNGGL